MNETKFTVALTKFFTDNLPSDVEISVASAAFCIGLRMAVQHPEWAQAACLMMDKEMPGPLRGEEPALRQILEAVPISGEELAV